MKNLLILTFLITILLSCNTKEKNKEETSSKTESNQTIYFGGGTPSVLDYDEIMIIFEGLYKYFKIFII